MADFKRLGYFIQIAELGSLTRAAERLCIAQPVLSRQMRLLEEELGVTLFTRGHRGMQLTEAGEALRGQISGPLRQIGHALYEIRSLPTETTGTVSSACRRRLLICSGRGSPRVCRNSHRASRSISSKHNRAQQALQEG